MDDHRYISHSNGSPGIDQKKVQQQVPSFKDRQKVDKLTNDIEAGDEVVGCWLDGSPTTSRNKLFHWFLKQYITGYNNAPIPE